MEDSVTGRELIKLCHNCFYKINQLFWMELNTVKDAFDRVVKKQKLSSKANEVIDQLDRGIQAAILKLQSTMDHDGPSDNPQTILMELSNKLNEIGPLSQIESSQKELNIALSKYAKVLERSFFSDISKSFKNTNFDAPIINRIIASHFYRQGSFDLGDSFIAEAQDPDGAASLKAPFLEMYQILEAMKSRNLEPALNWAALHRDQLLKVGSKLELKLHRLQFVEVLQKGNKKEALQYVRTHITPFASVHMPEIQKLMACLLWADRLDQSPYAEVLSATHWETLAEELTRDYCFLLGQPFSSPLGVVIAAGIQGLPTLLKLSAVMAAKNQEWQTMKQLPVSVDLGKEFQFHSIFVCPVSREQGTEENPPMLLPCGHVLCKLSIVKLSKSSTRTFKCPYCPSEATVAQCRQLHF